jgi:hypothetical protein
LGSRADYSFENRNELIRETAPPKEFFRRCAPSGTETRPFRWIADQALDASGKGCAIAGRMQQCAAGQPHNLRGATRVADDNWFSARHRFDYCESKWLGLGARVHNDIERANCGRDVIDKSGEANAFGNSKPFRARSQLIGR